MIYDILVYYVRVALVAGGTHTARGSGCLGSLAGAGLRPAAQGDGGDQHQAAGEFWRGRCSNMQYSTDPRKVMRTVTSTNRDPRPAPNLRTARAVCLKPKRPRPVPSRTSMPLSLVLPNFQNFPQVQAWPRRPFTKRTARSISSSKGNFG